ncbi:MAG: hypothetical protein EBW11_09975, partial [Betaproteobacteria bacterium]|nr:hypothetical protein [Betaproteobacteria bacterium]
TDSLRGVIRRIIRTEDDLEPNIWRGRKLKRDVRGALMKIARQHGGAFLCHQSAHERSSNPPGCRSAAA